MSKKLLITAIAACLIPLGIGLYQHGPFGWSKNEQKTGLKTLRVPNATLKTPPLTRSEAITVKNQKTTDPLRFSFIRPDSKVELEAHYRHKLELKDTWSFLYDPKRHVAFIIIPDLSPVTPVEFNVMSDKKVIAGFEVDSKWFWRFEDQKQMQEGMELLKKWNDELVVKASSHEIIQLREEESLRMTEEFIRKWLIKEGHCKPEDRPIVKVFGKSDLTHFPPPKDATLAEFIP